jgi:hypothetical protein
MVVEAAGIEPASRRKKTKNIQTLRFADGGAEEVHSPQGTAEIVHYLK